MVQNREGKSKRVWVPMKLSAVGHVSQVVEGGNPGKLSPSTFDPGDIFKPPGRN